MLVMMSMVTVILMMMVSNKLFFAGRGRGVIIEANTEILLLGLCARSSVVFLINKFLEVLASRFFTVSIILQRAKYNDHHHETIYDWDTKEEMADFISESRAKTWWFNDPQ